MSSPVWPGTVPRTGTAPPRHGVRMLAWATVSIGVLVAAATGSRAAAGTTGIGADPVVRWGGLFARLMLAGATTVTIGVLVAVAFLLPAGRTVSEPGRRLLRVARGAAWVWCLAALGSMVLAAAELAGVTVGRLVAEPGLLVLVLEVPRGRALTVVALATFAVALHVVGIRTRLGAQIALLVVAAATLPTFSSGHGGGGQHVLLAEGRVLHVLAVVTWVGGLVAMLILVGYRADLAHALPRFGALALGCYVTAGVGGMTAAVVVLGTDPGRWASSYGVLLGIKVLALAGLGLVGWLHRRRTVPSVVAGSDAGFVRLASVELFVMGAAGALGVVVSVTAPPVGALVEPGAGSHDGVLEVEPVGLTLGLLALAAYAGGVVGARARGVRWSTRSASCWVAAVVLAVGLASAVHEPASPAVSSAVLVGGAVVLPALVIGGRPLDLVRIVHEQPRPARLAPRVVADPVNAAAVLLAGLVVLGRLGTADRSAWPWWSGAAVLLVAVVVGLVGLAPLLGGNPAAAPGTHGERPALLALLAVGLLAQGTHLAWRSGDVAAAAWPSGGGVLLLTLAAGALTTSRRSPRA